MNSGLSLKTVLSFCALLGIATFIYSCHKDNNSIATYDFSYSGNLWVGENVSFTSTAPAHSTFLWKFGDGTTSTEAAPVHVYESIPHSVQPIGNVYMTIIVPDTVVLIVNNDTAHPIIKTLQLAPGIQRVAGMRTWRRMRMTPGGIAQLPDTSLTLTVSSDTVVNILGSNFIFDNISSTVAIGPDSRSVNPNVAYYFFNSSAQGLAYTYPADSLTINISNTNDPFDYDYTVYQSP